MVSQIVAQSQPLMQRGTSRKCSIATIACSVGIMAYNEEENIKRNILAILAQTTLRASLSEIIVVASGCTDNTVSIVEDLMQFEPRIQLIVQERREGKASAINLFLQQAHSPFLILIDADVLPEHDTLEKLCSHFSDATVGMVGPRQVPVNEEHSFIGHAVHLQWMLHDRLARRNPKLGNLIAFRNIVQNIPTDITCDEVSIEAAIAKAGLTMVYEPEAVIYKKGPLTVADFLNQRRRVHADYRRIPKHRGNATAPMKIGPVFKELIAVSPYTMHTPLQFIWTLGALALEGVARVMGRFDALNYRPAYHKQLTNANKHKEDARRKTRRICTSQSVIVFHIVREDAEMSILQQEEEDHSMSRALHKLLPLMHRAVRHDDMLSINGANTIIAVLNAEQHTTEIIALRLKNIIATQRISLGKQKDTRVLVSSHVVSFGQ